MPVTPLFRNGDRGPAVAEIRARLARLGLIGGSEHVRIDDSLRSLMFEDLDARGESVDREPAQWDTTALVSADFDDEVEAAVRAFQSQRGITVDGIVGPETFRRLEEARWRLGDRVLSFAPAKPFVGEDVLQLQRHLNLLGFDCGKEDAHFGPATDHGLREFQRNTGLEPDGITGAATLRAIGRLHRTVGTGSANAARERYALPQLQTGVDGKLVVLDAVARPQLRTAMGRSFDDDAFTDAVCRKVAGRLAEAGARTLHHGPGSPPSSADEVRCATVANDQDADLVVSVAVDFTDGGSSPLTVFYFGRGEALFSAAGRAAAEAVCEELAPASPDGRCDHGPRTTDILRLTRMPAIRVSFGGPATTGDLFAEAGFQDRLATALAAGICRFFEPADDQS
jgi:N-acetylmuramoyl-L-alanine amidase